MSFSAGHRLDEILMASFGTARDLEVSAAEPARLQAA